KRSTDCRTTGGDHRVAARSKGDLGVASHLNQSAATESDRIPSGARVDGAIAGNANAVVAAADADPALPDRYGVVRISRGDRIGAGRLDQTSAAEIEGVLSAARIDGAVAAHTDAIFPAADTDSSLADYSYGVVAVSGGDRVVAVRAVYVDALI